MVRTGKSGSGTPSGGNDASTPVAGPSSGSAFSGNAHVRFSCVGCGACCRGRFVPLTQAEALSWIRRGQSVAVLIEAFDESTWSVGAPEYAYNSLRSAPVQCGTGTVRVIIILAANALPQCPNLQDDGRCSIYLERPLVCRIYPMEISPFIELQPSHKDCPPDSWTQGGLIASDQDLREQIRQSRQADRDDVQGKIALCEALGLTVAGWKGNSLVIHQPSVDDLLAAYERLDKHDPQPSSTWRIKAHDSALREYLENKSAALEDEASGDYIFHSTQG